ncbi:hypothetical protein [Amycolatopsis vastitatis]|uniref:Uncharacterized protein n=1 Tax=Amycolatopsis vastitatis TaxID=1905142 RepID=A0A229T2U4_9PSEU|nr:hypothetical protein [Amycolatopsis vastitatis]OXM65330.1 hypothetical protein CF165_23680 [Amycolatopsis vastitatis]
MPDRRSPDRITLDNDPNYVGLEELFEAAVEPAIVTSSPGTVLEPPCRRLQRDHVSPHPVWELLRQILFGDPAHIWRSALLLVVLGAVVCGILLAGSVALTAAGAALVGLVGLLRLSRWQANRVRLG